MSGLGYRVGLAVASFEWIAAIALILYAKFFLPYYLKSRITTMPEFLERRFNHKVRLVYAIISLIGYIVIELAAVLYTGAFSIREIFGLPMPCGLAILVPTIPFLNRAIIDFLLAMAIIWAFRTRGDAIPANAVVDRSFPPEVAAETKRIPWYGSFRFWGTLLVLLVIALYVRFF